VPEGINGRFLHYQLQASDIAAKDSSTAVPSLRRQDLEELDVVLAPTAEQRRIVGAIEEQFSRIDAGVEAFQRARRNLQRMRAAVLWAAVTGRLVPQDPSDEPAEALLRRSLEARQQAVDGEGRVDQQPATPDLDKVPEELPRGWVWTSLDALAEIVGGITKDAKRQMPEFPEVPYLRVANVQRGYLDLSEITTIRAHPDKVQHLRLLPGDILFTEGGDRDKLGRGWIWGGQIDPCIHQNHIFRARLYNNEIDPRFVSWHANTFGQVWFVSAGKQTTNLASVSLNRLKRLPVPLPPVPEQRRIAAEVERMMSLIDALSRRVEVIFSRATSLRTAVLQAAFTGRLVPQDPVDGPAKVLLDRIKVARSPQELVSVHPRRRSR
jgi:type I restriction enzyme S subunit